MADENTKSEGHSILTWHHNLSGNEDMNMAEQDTSKEVTMIVVREWSDCPGTRERRLCQFSGEEFREEVLEPALKHYGRVVIDMDGTDGYFPSWLEEVFGGVVRTFGPSVKKRLLYLSSESADIAEIEEYIRDAIAKFVSDADKRSK